MDIYDADVIKSLGNKAGVVRQLVGNARNKLVINTKGAYYYKNGVGKYELLTGLLPRLRKSFFPDMNIFNLLKKPKKAKRRKGKRVKKVKKESKGWSYGKLRGSIVHQEIEDFLFLDKKNFCKKHPSIHTYTHRILKFILETMQWRLLRSEFDIFDEALRLATSVDIIAVTPEGKLVLIEVKCGYTQTFDNSDGQMHGALRKLSNSPHNQANLQIISGALLIVKHHHIALEDMLLYVIRVDDDDLHYYKVNNEYVQKKGPKIYQQLLRDSKV